MKMSVHLKFLTTIASIPLLSAEKKVFENSLNTSWDIAVLPGQCKGKNWNFYIFGMLEKL